MCKKPRRLRRAVGRGTGFSPLRGLTETIMKPLWERFPTDRLAHRLTPPAQITHETVRLDYPGAPLRLAFLSDLHAGPTTPAAVLERAFALATEARPDVVLLGGDYVFYDADNIDRIAEPLARVAARFPTFGVWGNHDLWADDAYLERVFAQAGVRMLRNAWERELLDRPIDLYGVDDPWTGEPDFAPLLAAERPVVLLCHNPDGILMLDQAHRADVMLCGHTHGGQICRRDGSPYMVHAKTGTRFAGGRYRHDDKHVIVSKGVGAVEVPVRRYAPPEVVVIDIEPAAMAAQA